MDIGLRSIKYINPKLSAKKRAQEIYGYLQSDQDIIAIVLNVKGYQEKFFRLISHKWGMTKLWGQRNFKFCFINSWNSYFS